MKLSLENGRMGAIPDIKNLGFAAAIRVAVFVR